MLTQQIATIEQKPFAPAHLDTELSRLCERRAGLEADLEKARTGLDAAREQLVTGKPDVGKVTTAQSTFSALTAALASLDARITAKERELAEAEVAQKWEDAVDAMVPSVQAAAEALRRYEEHAEVVNKILAEHIPTMAECFQEWMSARTKFVQAVRVLLPEATPKIEGMGGGREVVSSEANAAGNRLVKALEARCEDVRPVLARVDGQPLCIDLKTFQIALQAPYGQTANGLAQNIVVARQEEQRQKYLKEKRTQ